MGAAREIRRHKMFAYALTAAQAMVVVAAAAQIAKSPLGVFLSPPGDLVRSLFSARTVMLWIAAYLHLAARAARADGKAPGVVFFRSFVSQTMFFHYFLRMSRVAVPGQGLVARVSVDVHSAYNMVLSGCCAAVWAYCGEMLWVEERYTRTRGLFKYMGRSMAGVCGAVAYLYTVGTGMAMGVLGAYLVVSRVLIPWGHAVIPMRLAYEASWRMSRDFLLTNVSSAMYLVLSGVIDRLVVYNMSMMNLGLGEYSYEEGEDLEESRLRFFQVSGLCMRYPQVLRRVARSNRSIVSLGMYMRREGSEVLKAVDGMRREREAVESRMWFSVPQVSQQVDKPKALVMQRRVRFVKRIRSYNFVEILVSRVVYFYRLRVLINRYRDCCESFLVVRDFMRFLEGHRNDYLLLNDLEGVFAATARRLHDEVAEAEKVVGRCLDPDVFCK